MLPSRKRLAAMIEVHVVEMIEDVLAFLVQNLDLVALDDEGPPVAKTLRLDGAGETCPKTTRLSRVRS